MKIKLQRETLVTPLQQLIGAVEKRQTLPVLANVLLSAKGNVLSLTATDTEIELQTTVSVDVDEEGDITVPARKLLDICKALPSEALIDLHLVDHKMKIKSGKSRYVLSTLSADEFPLSAEVTNATAIDVPSKLLHDAIKRTSFSMALQDVRFYLNGLLLEVSSNALRCIATDGHRLAFSSCAVECSLDDPIRAIIPRKSVLELAKLITPDVEDISLLFSQNFLRVSLDNLTLTTKLIDGRFPDYNRVIPLDCDKELIIDKTLLTQVLSRASILSNGKYRGIRLKFADNTLSISTNNPEQEEASDELDISYSDTPIDIGFNVSYLLEALNKVETENVKLFLKDGNSSCLISPFDSNDTKYVVMPMRL
jgi:DNA polymerase-3 subunit beta